MNEQDLQIIENQNKIIKKLEEESERDNQMLDQYKQDIKNLQEKLSLSSKSLEINDEKIKELEKYKFQINKYVLNKSLEDINIYICLYIIFYFRLKSELEMENESLKDNNNKLQERIYSVESSVINMN